MKVSETEAMENTPDNAVTHPWTRYVAMGDSFTEGIGDPEPASPGGHRGWADRVAEELSRGHEGFAYANLAVRGRLLQQIVDQQMAHCLSLKPDLITLSAGGNDLIRPGGDPDVLAEKLDSVVQILSLGGATVVLFNGPDTGSTVLGRIRSKVVASAIPIEKPSSVTDGWSGRTESSQSSTYEAASLTAARE